MLRVVGGWGGGGFELGGGARGVGWGVGKKNISRGISSVFYLLKFATHSTGSLQFIIIGIVDLCVFFMH